MAPKFVIDINLPGLSAEEQAEACKAKLEEVLEDLSATPLSLECSDPTGVDTRKEEEEEPPKPAPTKKGPDASGPVKPGMPGPIVELYAILSRETKSGAEGIMTLSGQPIVFGNKERFEQAKKRFKAMLQADPAPAGLRFFAVKFNAKMMLEELK